MIFQVKFNLCFSLEINVRNIFEQVPYHFLYYPYSVEPVFSSQIQVWLYQFSKLFLKYIFYMFSSDSVKSNQYSTVDIFLSSYFVNPST